MQRKSHSRFLITILLTVSLFTPLTTFATGGNGHFKDGLKYEESEQWDKAAEEFALAVASSPKNPEYKLHLTRALFNASQMFIKKGTIAANEKDYEGGYNAFRRAYAYDPTNDFAKSEMERMVRMQQASVEGKDPARIAAVPSGPVAIGTNASLQAGYVNVSTNQIPQKLERLRDVPFPGGVDLQFIIKELARDLDLNVLFDSESRLENRKVKIELHNVTSAKALDYIFLQEGLFFQKVGPRTIIVANQTQRTKFQQLVLRTFYLSNASPKDVAKVVQTAIPAQPGRSQTIVLTDDATNSITIRDTAENIRLIGKLIQSLDKDRAEVVMDVAIYEVNKTDLLQLGNQIGSQSQLTNLGGSQAGLIGVGGKNLVTSTAAAVGGAAATTALPLAIPTGILLPAMTMSAFQSKNNTKLVASTQIHAFNNEDSSALIGQRVPVRSATFQTGTPVAGTSTAGVVSDVINYEQIGLTLKFKPLVFPNQDVQVSMEIESKDVAGAQTLTPTFTARTIKGTARIQNNKTLLLASVATGQESSGKQGLPLLGLLPFVGRFFASPTKDDRQIDIVIAVTPRVIRAPAILPEDEVEHDTGSLAVPTNSSLEAMIIEDEQQENIAAARRAQNSTAVQIAAEKPAYVPGTGISSNANPAPADNATPTTAAPQPQVTAVTTQTQPTQPQVTAVTTQPQPTQPQTTAVISQPQPNTGPQIRPIDNAVRSLQLAETADTSAKGAQFAPIGDVSIGFGGIFQQMKKGEKVKLPILLYGSANISSAVLGLKFDSKAVAVSGVSYGDVFGATVNTAATPFLNQNGKMYISLASPTAIAASGVLAYVEFEALVDGKPVVTFDRDVLNLLTADGKTVSLKAQE
ncbi:MAG: secretin N-terminal domain-containing protein [Pyrinomonadaceae bacterium]